MGVAVQQLRGRLTSKILLQVTQVLPRTETKSCRQSTGEGKSKKMEHYRADGVRITHDPYAPGMAEKYGMPGKTDQEGFDPYKDTVGPVYAGGGYTPINTVLGDEAEVSALLDRFPDLVNDMSTGGAQPLHMCGMSKGKENSVKTLVSRG